MPASESALLVPVPAAEPLVQGWRDRLDPSAGWGIPAHITVLYPFLPPSRIGGAVLDRLTALLRPVPPFAFELREVGWFGDEVLWLAPRPDAPFRALIRLVAETWPQAPPYEGRHPDPTPHLSVATGAPADLMHRAAEEIAPELPVEAFAGEVWLMSGGQSAASWGMEAAFALEGDAGPTA